MIRLPAGNLFASASTLGGACKFFQVARRQLRETGHDTLQASPADLAVMFQAASFLKSATLELGFVACRAAAEELGEVFRRLPRPGPDGVALTEAQLSDLIGALEYLIKTFRDELDGRPLFVGTARAVDLLHQDAAPFGEAVEDAFPVSAQDISEAAKCLALGRSTACVMHLMRALEEPLSMLAMRCGVEDAANWNTLLNQIESRLRQRGASQDEGWEQWASEAATHFRFIKNAWRNHAMHARGSYDEARANEIYGSVGSFLRHLAIRLQQ